MPDEQTPQPLPPPPPAFTPQPSRPPFGAAAQSYGAPYGQPYAPGYAQPGYAQPGFYAPQPPRAPRAAWFWPAIILGSILIFGLMLWGIVRTVMHSVDESSTTTTTFNSDRIAVIDVDGVIVDADKIDNQLRKFGDDSSVKAIVLHINSPGGGASSSQEIYHEVLRVRREDHKKVVASVESVGASGAYYIASACDLIYANEASVVGSVGVIIEWTNYGELMKWAKLKPVVIHAGALKDAGDPTRDMTPQEAAYFQSLVDNMYTQFVRDVAKGRHTTPERILPLATGQVWTGEQAIPLGLIDKIGGFRVALIDTARSVGIKDEPAIVRPSSAKKGLAGLLNGDADDLLPSSTKLLDHSPGFYFLWK